MKRKLIDIDENTFEVLSAEAMEEGTNLKQYIEGILDQKAGCLEDSSACKYRFSFQREPSDRELSAIMAKAAESAVDKKSKAMLAFFDELENSVKSAG